MAERSKVKVEGDRVLGTWVAGQGGMVDEGTRYKTWLDQEREKYTWYECEV